MRTIAMNLWSGWIKVQEVNPKIRSLFVSLSIFFKFCLLAVAVFLFGGNENANPTVGNSTVEFYSSEFRQNLTDKLSDSYKGENDSTTKDLLNKFYGQRQFLPAWTINFKTNESCDDLMMLIKSSQSFGFYPSMYSAEKLDELNSKLSTSLSENERLIIKSDLEKLATESAFRFMLNCSVGLNSAIEDSSVNLFRSKLPDYLNSIISSNDVKEGILKLQPKSEQYKLLQAGLVRFIKNISLTSVEYSVENFKMTEGLANKILVEQGYLDKSFINDSAAIIAAIKDYQLHNSLNVTGIADENTYRKLGRSTDYIFSQIALNLDRLRKDELKTTNYVLVNIPEFKLVYVNEYGNKSNFNVVVGKSDSPTPILESEIELIITNPHWTVPNSIAMNEIIPKIKTDSTYLLKHGYKIVDKDARAVEISNSEIQSIDERNFRYYIRQDNGEKNALGTLKFLFPNEYSVYLHDTPSKQYFKKDIRAYSHGCVRVENPEKLAEIIVSDHCVNKDDISISGLLRSKKQRTIRIDQPVPLYIKYYTCTADSLGGIYFYPDIYSIDEEAIDQLFASNYQE